jgi:hypothetical protein
MNGATRSVSFFVLMFLSVTDYSERKKSPPCPIPCLLSKLNALTSCARSARSAICDLVRFPPSPVDAVSPPATAPNPTILATTLNFVSPAPSMARLLPSPSHPPPPSARRNPRCESTSAGSGFARSWLRSVRGSAACDPSPISRRGGARRKKNGCCGPSRSRARIRRGVSGRFPDPANQATTPGRATVGEPAARRPG